MNCVHWQDFSHRVYTAVRDQDSASKLGLVVMGDRQAELRPCMYTPSPNVEIRQMVYVGGAYSCSDFRAI